MLMILNFVFCRRDFEKAKATGDADDEPVCPNTTYVPESPNNMYAAVSCLVNFQNVYF